MNEFPPLWHSVTCVCMDCLRRDDLYIGFGTYTPKNRVLFANPPEATVPV